MKVNLIAVGKIKEKYFRYAVDEYKKRLSRFCEFTEIEVKEESFVNEPNESEKTKILEKEGEEILKKAKGRIIAMCIEGKKHSSLDLSRVISGQIESGGEITFVIGGSYGLSDAVKSVATKKISFSDMTFPHTLFRVMLIEQIYRAFTIIQGSNYHK